MLVWITGLPGSGKTLLANQLSEIIKTKTNFPVVQLDGDFLRNILPFKMSHDIRSRSEISHFYSKLASHIESPDLAVVASFFSMFDNVRHNARENSSFYFQIFLNPPNNLLEEYNKKNLYSSNSPDSIRSQWHDLEFPKDSDIVIDYLVDKSNVQDVANSILDNIRLKGLKI